MGIKERILSFYGILDIMVFLWTYWLFISLYGYIGNFPSCVELLYIVLHWQDNLEICGITIYRVTLQTLQKERK